MSSKKDKEKKRENLISMDSSKLLQILELIFEIFVKESEIPMILMG